METKIGNYKGIEVTVTPVTYNDLDVQNQIDYLLQQNPVKVSLEGPVQEGHTTIMDFKGLKDGVAFPGGTAENYELTIGSHQFIPGFEEQMIGMNKGESRDLHVTFPENYGEQSLAGQEVVFQVTVHDIIEKKPAELTDEFAADFAKKMNIEGVGDAASLRSYTEKRLGEYCEMKTREAIENKVMDELMKMTECDIPQDRVDVAIQQQVSRMRQQLAQQGVTLEQYLKMTGTDKDTLRTKLSMAAQEQVKFEQALAKIIELEGISVTEEEVNEQVRQLAEHYNVSAEEAEKHVNRSEIAQDLINMKASQVVLNSAVVKKTN